MPVVKKEESDKKNSSSSSSSASTSTKEKKKATVTKASDVPLGENVFGVVEAEEDDSDSKVAGELYYYRNYGGSLWLRVLLLTFSSGECY